MSQTRRFPNHRGSVTAARRFVTAILADQPPDLVQTVELLVSELASNCVRHTDSDFEIAVTRQADVIRIAATDRGTGQPVMRTPDPLSTSGRGLPIIDMMSRAWGVDPARPPAPGKTVWFTVPVATAAPARSQASGDAAGARRR